MLKKKVLPVSRFYKTVESTQSQHLGTKKSVDFINFQETSPKRGCLTFVTYDTGLLCTVSISFPIVW